MQFIAQSIPSAEQAAKGLADQTWNQPVTWWLSFFLFIFLTALIFIIWRNLKKADAQDALINTTLMELLREMDAKIDRIWEKIVELTSRRGGPR